MLRDLFRLCGCRVGGLQTAAAVATRAGNVKKRRCLWGSHVSRGRCNACGWCVGSSGGRHVLNTQRYIYVRVCFLHACAHSSPFQMHRHMLLSQRRRQWPAGCTIALAWLHVQSGAVTARSVCVSSVLRPAFGCGWGWLAGAGGVLWRGQVLVGTPALGGYTCLVTAVVGFERAPHCEVGVCVCACRGLLAAGLAVDWGSVVWVLLWTTASCWLCLLGHVQDHYFTLHLPQQVMVCSCPQFEHCWTSRKRLVGARLSVDSAHFSRSISSPGVHHSCRRRTTFRHHGM